VPAQYTCEEFMILHAGISTWIGSKRGVQTGNASKPAERYVAREYIVPNLGYDQTLMVN